MVETVILHDYLEEIGDAVMSGDWNTYRRGVALPFILITHAANIVVDTETKLREGFDAFHQMLKSQNVTEYIRLVQSGSSLDPDMLSGTFITHMMSRGTRVVKPYTSQITLRLNEGHWQALSISSALTNSRWPLLIPSPADTVPEQGSKND